jgi:transcriptional regulator with XRE-family HTH domain
MNKKAVGTFVRLRREQLRLERSEFAVNLNRAYGSIANIEGGHTKPSAEMLIDLAGALGIRPGLLLDVYAEKCTVEEALSIATAEDFKGSQSYTPDELRRMGVTMAEVDIKGAQYLDEVEMLEQISRLTTELINRSKSRTRQSA